MRFGQLEGPVVDSCRYLELSGARPEELGAGHGLALELEGNRDHFMDGDEFQVVEARDDHLEET